VPDFLPVDADIGRVRKDGPMPQASLDFGPPRHLPPRPSLEHLKNEAKRRLRADKSSAKLAQVQHQLAREYGFSNWRDLKANVERLGALPGSPDQRAGIGDWIAVLPGDSRIAMHIRLDDGAPAVAIDMPGYGFFGMAADDVVFDDGRLAFTLLAPLIAGSHQGAYEAQWQADTQRWAGDWTVHGVTASLDFVRGAYPPAPSFEGLDGFWDSRLETPAGLVRLIVRFKTDRHGTYAWVDSPDRNLLGSPAVRVQRDGREVTVTMRTVTITGTMTDDGQWIEGRFIKEKMVRPLTLVRRLPGAAPPLPQRAPAIDVPPELLAKYVGRYLTELGMLVDVSLEGGRLFAQFSRTDHQSDDALSAGPKLDLLASSPTRFFWRIMDASVEFERAADGRVTGMVMRQNGRDSRAVRIG
jgi:hypothetical protein